MDPYYNRPEVSNSDLSALKKELYGGNDHDPTEAYRFGNLIDCMITEPEKVDFINRSVQGVGEFTVEQWETARKMKKAFLANPLCRNMYSHSKPQSVMVVQEKQFNYEGLSFSLDVRCKWDLWMPEMWWGGDIKSTTATTPEQFLAAAKHFDYDRQRFWYMNIAGSKQDILIGISKVNYKVFLIKIEEGDEFWEAGRRKALDLAFQYWIRFGDIK